ncbi:MAG TPA: hypothetical protein VFM14_13340, partial [Gemmatimonadales bacterium]|nr:hypothetical protein [Gemmatimonadales bacterium]
MRTPALLVITVLTLATPALQGCGRPDAETASAAGARGAGSEGAVSAASAVRTAERPSGACDWIPAAEVEEIVGPLAGPPKAVENGCLYPLPVDTLTAKRREAAKKLGELAKQLEKQFPPTDTMPALPPPETAVIVDVRIGDPAQERGLAAGFDMLEKPLDDRG